MDVDDDPLAAALAVRGLPAGRDYRARMRLI